MLVIIRGAKCDVVHASSANLPVSGKVWSGYHAYFGTRSSGADLERARRMSIDRVLPDFRETQNLGQDGRGRLDTSYGERHAVQASDSPLRVNRTPPPWNSGRNSR